ncbi:MAG: HAMP domain-containing sensor histidine kinase [Candidatus Saccharimonadales bacterium]|nr:HAMP domain-containing sensor histidine kinase [Candidatus Saccharimonadales bacterium]
MSTDKKQAQKPVLRPASSLDLVASTAHDMKTPLVLINGLAERLLDDELPEPQRRQYLERLLLSSERLLHLIESLNSAHRAERGRDLEMSPVNVQVVINDVIDEHQLHAKHRHQKLKTSSKKGPVVLTNRMALYRILSNLVDNAIKYSEPNGEVQVVTNRRGNLVSIMIRDRGIGIKRDDMNKIFSLFGQAVEPSNAVPGSSGLGLFIAKQLAESIKGNLNVVPIKEGSTFTLTLPVAQQLELFE